MSKIPNCLTSEDFSNSLSTPFSATKSPSIHPKRPSKEPKASSEKANTTLSSTTASISPSGARQEFTNRVRCRSFSRCWEITEWTDFVWQTFKSVCFLKASKSLIENWTKIELSIKFTTRLLEKLSEMHGLRYE